MRIAILLEGKTERAFFPHLRQCLATQLTGRMPKLLPVPCDGLLPTGAKLKREVNRLTGDPSLRADAVIALTDIYTGRKPPIFDDAADAKRKMRQWVGKNDSFFPHAAQFEFEAWLLPY